MKTMSYMLCVGEPAQQFKCLLRKHGERCSGLLQAGCGSLREWRQRSQRAREVLDLQKESTASTLLAQHDSLLLSKSYPRILR